MNAMTNTTSAHLRAAYPLADEAATTQAESCGCHAAIAAFERVAGPRLRRAAPDEDTVECVDAADSEKEPATMMQRIPV